ncbi:MAG: hypothetical protein LUD47_05600 [Clostridia bacterium]|nr:hypothetical protein [Clostridia bacterium]
MISVLGFSACGNKITDTSSGEFEYPEGTVCRIYVPDLTDSDDAAALVLNDGYFSGCDFTVSPSLSSGGNVIYRIGGTSSRMTADVATWYGVGAKEGDDYVTLKIYVPVGSTISFVVLRGTEVKTLKNDGSPDNEYFDGDYMYLVFRLTGHYPDGTEMTPPDLFDFTVTWNETVVTEEIVYAEDGDGNLIRDEDGNCVPTGEVIMQEEDFDMEEKFSVTFSTISLVSEAEE